MRTDSDTHFRTFLIMLALLVIPAALTLRSVVHPGVLQITSDDPTPYGYTWSQLIFIIPTAVLAYWFRWHPHFHFLKKPFLITALLFFGAGMCLDVFLGNTFFTFAYPGAILGIHLPGLTFGDGGVHLDWTVPLEEIAFYGFGILFMLLFYIWGNANWVVGIDRDEYRSEARQLPKLASLHWGALLWGAAVEGVAILYRTFAVDTPGFPGYLTVLNIGFITFTALLFRVLKPFINWRMLSLSVLVMMMMSMVWEATLALNYGWWNYHHEWMVGIFIGAWADLPIEEPILWTYSTIGAVMLYEALCIHFHMERPLRESFLGSRA